MNAKIVTRFVVLIVNAKTVQDHTGVLVNPVSGKVAIILIGVWTLMNALPFRIFVR